MLNKNIDYNGLIAEVGKCCLSEDFCGRCDKKSCLVGYCEQSLLSAFKNKDEYLDDGLDYIPYEDTKIYDEEKLINAIAFILNQCKNCQLYHDEDCIINIIRSALEVALLGDYMDYKGSTLIYFKELKDKNEEVSKRIFNAFNQYINKG
ncbi:MAG: hypothetical protein GXY88_10125 [Tissierellia bacterium]|nr:hypothetical protein [Tissierellia bacterium]